MSFKPRASLLSLAIIIGLVFSAVSPSIVYADGDTTPQPAPTEATSNPTEEVVVTPQPTDAVVSTEQAAATEAPTEAAATPAPTEEVAPTDPVAATEAPTEAVATPAPTEEVAPTDPATAPEPAPTDAAAAPAEGSTTPTTDSSVLSSVPDNTTVTVLDTNGNAEPLATQAAADAIATSDPIWCPGNQDPTPGANGCTQSFNSFDALLTFLSGNSTYQGVGTIYVQQGAYQGNDPNKVINLSSPSYNLSNINQSDLTITGGWNPSNNTIDSANPTTFSNYSILIGADGNPWGGSLTITNIVVTDALNGIELHATGSVNIKDSKFDHNRRNGAIIRAGQDVNIANSSFSNGATGRSQRVGLDIVSGGSTSLFGVIANGNRFTGTNINAGGEVNISSSDFSHTKHAELGGKSFYDTRLLIDASGVVYSGYGLLVITPSTVSLDNVTASDNFLWGASLDAGGDIAISNSVFNTNTTSVPSFIDDTGLIITGDANVALDNVTASDNRLYGALIDATGTVSISNSTFDNNRGVINTDGVTTLYGHGLKVNSLADIFINNTSAVNNMLFGGQLTAAGQVSVSDSNFSDTSTDPGQTAMGKGLDIVSTGNASLANVILNNNQTNGADIKASGDIFLDVVTATNNAVDGVAVQNSCTHLFGGEYSGNGQYGLNLGNSALDLESPATMFNNGAGNIFPATPAVCSSPLTPTVPGQGPAADGVSPAIGTGGATANNSPEYRFVGYFTSTTTGPDISTENVSLNSFLANNTMGIADFDPSTDGVFTGRYVYVHSNDGLIYIVALLPLD